MAYQIQLHIAGLGWRVLQILQSPPTPALETAIRQNSAPIQLWDAALDRVRVRSRSAPRYRKPRGIERHRTFDPIREVDPYNIQPSRVRIQKTGVYPMYSDPGPQSSLMARTTHDQEETDRDRYNPELLANFAKVWSNSCKIAKSGFRPGVAPAAALNRTKLSL